MLSCLKIDLINNIIHYLHNYLLIKLNLNLKIEPKPVLLLMDPSDPERLNFRKKNLKHGPHSNTGFMVLTISHLVHVYVKA